MRRSALPFPASLLALPASLLALSSATCSDDSVSAAQACADYASAFCKKVTECAPLYIEYVFGDFATCAARLELTCQPTLSAAGSTTTPRNAEDCAKVARDMACAELFNGTPPPACKPHPGTLGDGTACGANAQCKSSYCNRKADSGCGACGPKVGAGAACNGSDDACETGFICHNDKCAARVAAGGACDDEHPCRIDLTCRKKVCATPFAPGAACDPLDGLGACDFAKGTTCGLVSKVCETLKVAKPGEACGLTGGAFVACNDCKLSGAAGTCQAPAADGTACNDLLGPKCASPARCVSGLCKLDDPAMCH